ncbi:MAG: Gx transporter family protein [Ruminococcus sp.]|nr:Gx transporter family protein [Ruminococcus sp.]
MNVRSKKSEYAAVMGVFLSLTAALSAVDSMISSALPAVGIRLGLANIPIIVILVKYGIPQAGALSVMRSFFVFLTRGASAGIMSFAGGLLSFVCAAVLIKACRRSYKFSCIMSAVCHIIGQLAVSCVYTGSVYTLYYAPVLIPASIAAGFLTGTVAEAVLKSEKNIFGKDLK